MSVSPIKKFFFNAANQPTKKATGLAVTLLAIGLIGAFISSVGWLSYSHHLPNALSMPFKGNLAASIATGASLLGGIVLASVLHVMGKKPKDITEHTQ